MAAKGSGPDPISVLRRSARRTAFVGVAGLVLVIIITTSTSTSDGWTQPSWPPQEASNITSAPSSTAVRQSDGLAKSDAARARLYSTAIWIPDPKPVVAAAAVPPPAPTRPTLRFQLLGIHAAGVDGPFAATLYDPDTDQLLVVRSGDRVGVFDVDQVRRDGVDLRDVMGIRTLELDTDKSLAVPKSASSGRDRAAESHGEFSLNRNAP